MSTTEKADQQFVRLPRDLYYKLVEIAEREDRSVAGTVRNIVREAIARRTITHIGDRDPSGEQLGDGAETPRKSFYAQARPRGCTMSQKSEAAAAAGLRCLTTPDQELADLRQHLLEAYYVVSEFAYDLIPDRDRLKRTLSDALNDDASEEDMYAALGYALAWVNGNCSKKRPAWAKLFAEPIVAAEAAR